MSGEPPFNSRILPAAVFERLSMALQEAGQTIEDEVLVLTDASLPSGNLLLKRKIHRFSLVVSSSFSGLLQGTLRSIPKPEIATVDADVASQEKALLEQYETSLYFKPEDIAAFLKDLQREYAHESAVIKRLTQAACVLQSNDPTIQAAFILQLAEGLIYQGEMPMGQVCPINLSAIEENEFSFEQDTVFSQVATQIRQTQELSLILRTTIQQVRSFLQADRVVIYQFESTLPKPQGENARVSNFICGRITYEDRANEAVPRVLNLSEGIQCFIEVPDYKEKYRKGAIQAIDDIRVTYAEAPCLINLLEWSRVKAKLVVPIVVQEELWGLLIAHQCSGTRHWVDSEIRFLRCVAELLAIAIYQSQLYGRLHLQTQTLEQRVIERTQELHDALNVAQSANLAKTEFLAAVSHELRTPLTAIIGMSTTLLRLPDDPRRERLLSSEKQQDYLRIIRNSGEHLLELINDILDLSQVEAGRTVLEVQEFSLSQVANECFRMLHDKAIRNQLKLEMDLRFDTSVRPKGKTDSFVADPRRLKQILLNLLSNAIKFTPEGGRVILRMWIENNMAVLQVEDTGIGIPHHQFPLLFKKFQQLDTSYHRQYEGTGLGLALTKQLVDLHGGSIDVKSKVNVGSTFTIWLPAQPLRGKVVSEPSQVQIEPVSTKGRIVLIENHESTATLICDLLIAAGHQVIWMIDGITALKQIEIIQPEAVVFDTQLNGMSATEVLHSLRQNSATRMAKVLVLSSDDETDRDRWLCEGADECLSLPISHPEELLDKVKQMMRPDS